jgi:hypothetical protein
MRLISGAMGTGHGEQADSSGDMPSRLVGILPCKNLRFPIPR